MSIVSEAKNAGPSITLRQAQLALHHLLNLEGSKAAYWKQRDTCECILEEHPFGLETRLVLSHLPQQILDNNPRLIAFPGHTDTSVQAMKLMVQHHAMRYEYEDRVHFRLRVVRVHCGEKRHDLYFELITGVGTFICGGCNDYSGAGGSGGRELESIFTFIAALYEVPLEEVFIPEEVGEVGEKKLTDAYNDFERRRSAQAA